MPNNATIFRFCVPTLIRPKQRPRQGRGGHFYTPKETQVCEQIVATYAKLAMGRSKPFAGPCLVRVDIFMQPPKKPLNIYPCKGDLDNRCKLLFDGMNGIVWNDDKQVVRLIASQFYGRDHALIRVTEIDDIEQQTLAIIADQAYIKQPSAW